MTTTEMLTEEQLAEIETRARLATPPPWLVNPDPRKYVQMPFSAEEDVLRDRDANAAFCANARDDVPRLIAEIRRLRTIFDCDLDEMQAAFSQNILRHWDRDRITKFATWLLGEDQTTALNHLDRIIDTYQQTGLGPMLLAIRAAKEWRGAAPGL